MGSSVGNQETSDVQLTVINLQSMLTRQKNITTEWARRSKKYTCEFCEKSFVLKRDYSGHVNAAHLFERPFTCERCKRSFAGRKTLNNHKKTCAFYYDNQGQETGGSFYNAAFHC